MATATTGRTNSWAKAHVVGPFEVYMTLTHKHQQVETLAEAHEKAVKASEAQAACAPRHVKVLAADLTVIGWAWRGVWHGAVA